MPILNTLPYRASIFLLLITQGAALGYGIHWAFSPFKLNPKLELPNIEHLLR